MPRSKTLIVTNKMHFISIIPTFSKQRSNGSSIIRSREIIVPTHLGECRMLATGAIGFKMIRIRRIGLFLVHGHLPSVPNYVMTSVLRRLNCHSSRTEVKH